MNDSPFAQNAKVMGDEILRKFEPFEDIAYTFLAGGEIVDDADTCGMAKDLKERCYLLLFCLLWL